MKAKYQTKKKFKNADDTFVYNTAKYCKIIAKKYGKNTKEIEKIFNKFFEFLDEKGLLTGVVKRRINDNIKTMYFENKPSIEGHALAFYIPGDNYIGLNYKHGFKDNSLIHEFTHLLTTSCFRTDKHKLKFLTPLDKKNQETYYQNNTGFQRSELLIYDRNETNSLQKLDLDSLIKNLKVTYNAVFSNEDDDKLKQASKFLYNKVKIKKELKIAEEIINILFSLYDFSNINIASNRKNQKELLEAYIHAIKTKQAKPYKNAEIQLLIEKNDEINEILHIKLINETFYVTSTKFEETPIDCMESNRNFNEGMNEFITRLFMADFTKQRYLGFNGYNLQVKYCEMMYKIFGDKLLEAFFEQDRKKLASLMHISYDETEDEKEIFKNYEEFESWFDLACTPIMLSEIPQFKKQFKLSKQIDDNKIFERNDARNNVLNVLANCFAGKLTNEIFEFLDEYKTPEQIVAALNLSIVEFSKSFYFGDAIHKEGYCSKVSESERLGTLQTCAEILKIALWQIKNNYEAYKDLGIFTEEDAIKLEGLPCPDYDEFGNELDTENTKKVKEYVDSLFPWCVKANENAYYFTEIDLKEIHPLEFVKGRAINLFDENRQEYKRNSTRIYPTNFKKYPTIKKFKNLKNDIEFTL